MLNTMNPYSSLKKPATIFFLLLFSSSITVAGNAHAGNERWKAIAGKTGEERILYDPDSIIPSGPRTFRVWIMGFDANGFPRKSQEEFDCSNKIVRDIEVISEKPGKPVTRATAPSDWRGVVRETPRGELFKILCR
jgi:hypothetical protein